VATSWQLISVSTERQLSPCAQVQVVNLRGNGRIWCILVRSVDCIQLRQRARALRQCADANACTVAERPDDHKTMAPRERRFIMNTVPRYMPACRLMRTHMLTTCVTRKAARRSCAARVGSAHGVGLVASHPQLARVRTHR
jgi:hypothetical protein